jgi:hypothetical protein
LSPPAILQRRRVKAVGQGEVVALQSRAGRLPVELAAAAADPARDQIAVLAAPAVEEHRGAGLGLQGARRLDCHQVDRASQPAGTVQHRHIAFRDLHLGKVGGQEAGDIDAVVCRQEHPHAVDRDRRLETVESTHEGLALVARAAAVVGRHAGDQRQRLVEALSVVVL